MVPVPDWRFPVHSKRPRHESCSHLPSTNLLDRSRIVAEDKRRLKQFLIVNRKHTNDLMYVTSKTARGHKAATSPRAYSQWLHQILVRVSQDADTHQPA